MRRRSTRGRRCVTVVLRRPLARPRAAAPAPAARCPATCARLSCACFPPQVSSFEPVEKLTELGVSATDVKKLKEAGWYTVEALFMRPKKARPLSPRGAPSPARLALKRPPSPARLRASSARLARARPRSARAPSRSAARLRPEGVGRLVCAAAQPATAFQT